MGLFKAAISDGSCVRGSVTLDPVSAVLASALDMTPDRDTIFALSSGRPPAAIAVVRISGPRAGAALEATIGRVPLPRRAALARVRDPASGEVIDEALVLWVPRPNSETGGDTARLPG